MSTSPSITVTPQSCLMDESVQVKVTGLDPSSVYTLLTTATDSNDAPFFTLAMYRSDDTGEIDLERTPALGGHFKGVHPMAPLAHLLPQRRHDLHAKFIYGDCTVPVQYQLEVYQGPVAAQLAAAGVEQSGLKPVCSVQHQRRLLAEGCSRSIVKHGRVRGSLLLPPGKGPFRGVVDIMGAGGGLREHRAAMLASRGFAVLAIAFFKYDDLPENYNVTFEIAYFDEAVQYLLSREEVSKDGVGVIGISKGGDFALNMAICIPQVKATVVINSAIVSGSSPTRLLDGTERPIVPLDMSKMILHPGVVMEGYYMHSDPRQHPDSIFPVEKAHGDILWMCSLADRWCDTSTHAELAVERCQKAGVPHKVKVLKYPGAGHIIEPPNNPFNQITQTTHIQWGGHVVEHCAAQEQCWKDMIAFFNEKLK